MKFFRRGKPSPGSSQQAVFHHPFKRGAPRNAPKLLLGLSLLFIVVLLALPTGFEGAYQFKDAVKCKVEIIYVDNFSLIDTGLIRTGQQVCRIRFLNGKFRGQTSEGWNILSGALSQDKLFRTGDKAQAVVHHDDEEIISVNLIDYYRLDGELILALAFAIFLVVFARGVGVRSVLSFIITILVLWKILVPLFLKGFNPISTWLVAVASEIINTIAGSFGLAMTAPLTAVIAGTILAE